MTAATPAPGDARRVFSPGRVNLIGEHTDYSGGLALPMALGVGITITGAVTPGEVRLSSDVADGEVVVDAADPASADVPGWGRFLPPLLAELDLGPEIGLTARLTSDLPAASGLSSSSALSCGVALALAGPGSVWDTDRMALAQACQRAEIAAFGVNIGVMDQAAISMSAAGEALLLDCASLETSGVALPEGLEVLVAHTGVYRQLEGSQYNDRAAAAAELERRLGPLRAVDLATVEALDDDVLRRRGRHIVTENERVLDLVEVFAAGDLRAAGEILDAGHRSLSQDYETTGDEVDAVVARVRSTPGVLGARLTGGGFGGSLVAFAHPGTELDLDTWWRPVRPLGGVAFA